MFGLRRLFLAARDARLSILSCLVLAALVITAGCSDDDGTTTPPPPEGNYTVELERVYNTVDFAYPVDLRNAGDGSGRLFVVEQAGRIRYLDPSDSTSAPVFLDIIARVNYQEFSELGLLGLAFHPDYPTKPWFYLYYTRLDGLTRYGRLCRFQVNPDGNSADPSSEVMLLEVVQPNSNHNGGSLYFGEGTELYLGLGDGGGGGDPGSTAQDRTMMLGSILRIDVGMNESTSPYYGIPADNPYVGNSDGYAEQIYAYGMRNPWRMSYDAAANELWVGDVGQGQWEEVDIIVGGGNYGWDCREGFHPYTGPPGEPSLSCRSTIDFVDPLLEYPHENGDRSITGGFVYRGSEISSLQGLYVFADYGTGRIWSSTRDASEVVLLLDSTSSLSSFGVDESQELYVLGYSSTGSVMRFVKRLVPDES